MMHEVLEAVMHELKATGCSLTDLMTAGFSINDLQRAHWET